MPGSAGLRRGGIFANLPGMTTKTRNWLIVFFILLLPFAVFATCLVFMAMGGRL